MLTLGRGRLLNGAEHRLEPGARRAVPRRRARDRVLVELHLDDDRQHWLALVEQHDEVRAVSGGLRGAVRTLVDPVRDRGQSGGAMEFQLNEEEQMVQQMARDFAQREVAPLARELDREARWPTELVARMGELGLMGVAVPEELGGAGMTNV